MLNIDKNRLTEFTDKTGYDVGIFLQSFVDFIKFSYPRIFAFYSGVASDLEVSHNKKLLSLIEESRKISEIFKLNKDSLQHYDFWQLVDFIDDLNVKLSAINRVDKFLRSSLSRNSYSNKASVPYVLKSKQTLENIARTELKENNYDEAWLDVALENNLSEIDYTVKGGKSINLTINLGAQNLDVSGVIDNYQGEKLLGLDIAKKFEFVDDDLNTLGHVETAKQSVDILSELHKGDVPEYFDLGRGHYVGTTIKSFAFPVLVRELISTFSSDDTLSELKIMDVKVSGDAFSVSYEISTKVGLIVKNRFSI